MSTTLSRTFARALTMAAALVLAAGMFGVSTPVARAETPVEPQVPTRGVARTTSTTPTVTPKPSFGSRVVATAASRKGKPYAYGAAGPSRFDCSGLTQWTFKKFGKRLPHSSSAQYGRVKHLRAKDRRLGDLVFFHGSGGIYHVAIYAGKNTIWHAPYSGTRVRKERIWTSAVSYGRVR
ncbi:C40 family peptidase [Methylocystis sp.]|uniref:C40 family peptidase n=1 Tax=Methylocystis sp. TaxID=1911079 RepID=UPI003DA2C038